MKIRISVMLAVGVSLLATPSYALNCKKFKADFTQGQKDGAADAKESYPKDVKQHGYAASASDGLARLAVEIYGGPILATFTVIAALLLPVICSAGAYIIVLTFVIIVVPFVMAVHRIPF